VSNVSSQCGQVLDEDGADELESCSTEFACSGTSLEVNFGAGRELRTGDLIRAMVANLKIEKLSLRELFDG
jgi:hypothetical protein